MCGFLVRTLPAAPRFVGNRTVVLLLSYNEVMWKCHNCGRIFEKIGQVHSCQIVPLGDHFKNKDLAKGIFDDLLKKINDKVGTSEIVSLPCCVHLYGKYEFLAILPKKDRLEIRFSLDRALNGSRIKQTVPLSKSSFKNCIDLKSSTDLDKELIGWLEESYHLKEKQF